MANIFNRLKKYILGNLRLVLIYLGFIATLLFILIWLKVTSPDTKGPCSNERLPGKCYRVDETICNTAWNSLTKKCADQIKAEAANLRPGQLMGPIYQQCMMKNYDKVFHYMRKSDEPDCDSEFQRLDNPNQ